MEFTDAFYTMSRERFGAPRSQVELPGVGGPVETASSKTAAPTAAMVAVKGGVLMDFRAYFYSWNVQVEHSFLIIGDLVAKN